MWFGKRDRVWTTSMGEFLKSNSDCSLTWKFRKKGAHGDWQLISSLFSTPSPLTEEAKGHNSQTFQVRILNVIPSRTGCEDKPKLCSLPCLRQDESLLEQPPSPFLGLTVCFLLKSLATQKLEIKSWLYPIKEIRGTYNYVYKRNLSTALKFDNILSCPVTEFLNP